MSVSEREDHGQESAVTFAFPPWRIPASQDLEDVKESIDKQKASRKGAKAAKESSFDCFAFLRKLCVFAKNYLPARIFLTASWPWIISLYLNAHWN